MILHFDSVLKLHTERKTHTCEDKMSHASNYDETYSMQQVITHAITKWDLAMMCVYDLVLLCKDRIALGSGLVKRMWCFAELRY